MNEWARELWDILRDLMHEWREDHVTSLAAEIAFFGLLSVVPSLIVLTAGLGALDSVLGADSAERAEEVVVDFLETVLTSEADDIIDVVESLFETESRGLLTFGLIMAIWAASRAFTAVIRALDRAYDVGERRSYLRLRLEALGLAFGSLVMGTTMLAMLVLGPLLGTGGDVADAIGLGDAFATFWDVIRWPLVWVVMVAWAATVFHVAPNHRTPWRWDLPGAVLTALGWALLSAGLRVYLATGTEEQAVLGTLGGSLILVLWLYLLGIALLVGGELNAILAVRHGLRRPESLEGDPWADEVDAVEPDDEQERL